MTTTEQITALVTKFNGQFMRPEILTKLTVSQIENKWHECRFAEQGDENLEPDESVTVTIENASLCRLSASGYMDCTDWSLCRDEDEILEWLEREAEELQS